MISPDSSLASPSVLSADADGNVRATAQKRADHDRDLVRRFVAGDETAFIEIVSRHRERLISVAFAMLKDRGDAEEIAQDAFVRAHRGLAHFRGDCSLATWLYRVTLNLARNRYWYWFRRRRHTTISIDASLNAYESITLSEVMPADAADPARDAIAGEFSHLVHASLQGLRQPHRDILHQCILSQQSYDDMARHFGISVGTVKSRLARARINLLAILAQGSPDFGENARPIDWLDRDRRPRR